MIKLNELGFGPKLAMAIYQFYKEETLIIKQSPSFGDGYKWYRVSKEQIAEQVGISKDHHDRLVAKLLFLDQQSLQNESHTFYLLIY